MIYLRATTSLAVAGILALLSPLEATAQQPTETLTEEPAQPPEAAPPEAAPPEAAPPAAAPPPAAPIAPADSAPAEDRDGARFRGGIFAEAGALVLTDSVTLGVAGVNGQMGVQINDLIAIYAVPHFDIVFGDVGGVNVAAAAVVDFTFLDSLTIGGGPDVGAFAAFGSTSTSASAAAGALYGGRIHFGWAAIMGYGEDGIRRKALVLGADLRLLTGPAAAASASVGGATSASVSQFVISPTFSLGYQAF